MPRAILNWMLGEAGGSRLALRKDVSKAVHLLLLQDRNSKPLIKVFELISPEDCVDGPGKLLDWKK